jgi:hypothetical protein
VAVRERREPDLAAVAVDDERAALQPGPRLGREHLLGRQERVAGAHAAARGVRELDLRRAQVAARAVARDRALGRQAALGQELAQERPWWRGAAAQARARAREGGEAEHAVRGAGDVERRLDRHGLARAEGLGEDQARPLAVGVRPHARGVLAGARPGHGDLAERLRAHTAEAQRRARRRREDPRGGEDADRLGVLLTAGGQDDEEHQHQPGREHAGRQQQPQGSLARHVVGLLGGRTAGGD